MIDHYKLLGFELRDAGNGNFVVLISGEKRYYIIHAMRLLSFVLAEHSMIDTQYIIGEHIYTT